MILLMTAQLLVSLTLLVSGLAKLQDRTATVDAMTSLRLPARALHARAAAALPITEIVLALGIWIPVPVLQGVLATATLALVVSYLVIIARALTFGEAVTCSCFGKLGSPTVSPATLGRNAVLVFLAALALIAAVTGRTAAVVRLDGPALLSLALALGLAIGLTLLTLGTSRAATTDPAPAPARGSAHRPRPPHAPRSESAQAAPAPEPEDAADAQEELEYERSATPFGMLRPRGQEPITLATLTRERAALLIWLQPGCGPCERVLSAVAGWQEQLGDVMSIRTLFRRDPEELPENVLERAGDTASLDIDRNLMDAFEARHTPSAVLLGADGMLAGGPVRGGNDVIDFVEEIIEQLAEARENGELPV
ncbi:TlpA family protein disulfide reductase [Brachybacterium hainanense]|uniref:TlpA family protein disulfide reductase n=1 Tax=Brachybacterium hainanense TaxID=1541174 RepID=A0ABV6RCL4_9MICO